MDLKRGRAPLVSVDHCVQAHLGAELRKRLKSVAADPLPNEHVYLLLALRQRERDLRRP